MSHLPLDARAILDYLNELGYRNISAEQLKEFMKGMQSQSESYKSKLKAKISNSSNNNSQQQSQRREQYRQQQQQQQQQQHQPLQSSTSATTKSTAADVSEAAVGGNLGKSTPLPTQRRATVKVIKCKKPLCHFKFYLDICDHQLAKRIEDQIRTLGGELEFFLTASVTHFITDKAILPTIVGNNNNSNSNSNNNNNTLGSRPGTPQTPGTPKTPQTPYSYDTTTTTTQDGKNNVNVLVGGCNTPTGTISRKVNTRQTRANAILNRVRRASTTTNNTAINVNVNVNLVETPNSPTTPIINIKDVNKTPASIVVSTQNPYIVWQTEYALHFFKKVQHELKDYLGITNTRHDHAHVHKLLSNKGRNTGDPIDLKGGGFLKIEAIKRNYRPYYQLFRKSSGTEWPKIELTREDGAFRLSPKKKQQTINTVEVIAAAATIAAEVQEKGKEKEQVKYNDEEDQKMTRKSRSRSSQNQRPPLHAAVQMLKKGGAGGGGSAGAADSAATVKSSQRNSHAGGGTAAAAAAGCKQVKESSDKQCGVCEICKIEYDTLTIHLKTKDHEYFAKNSQNFIALDTLIHTSADVNKFLSEDKKVDLEEMEVENIEVIADANAPDPLEGSEPFMVGLPPLLELTDDKRRLAGGAHTHTPSPTLREKSKRSTKGKHSSEKFQNIRLSKSPKSTNATVTATTAGNSKSQTSPLKQQLASATTTTISSSMLELQRIDTTASATTVTAGGSAPARRKTISASALSPPIRAMLPPSSLYKVVGTPETVCTPIRKTRGELQSGGEQAAASPSLIVKFKKVRAAELNRLNGEAESFMFPKQRTSSELPTDVDRQTTSENARTAARSSSTSLDSTSDGPMDVEDELDEERIGRTSKSMGGKQKGGKRAISTAKRRKGKAKVAATKQRFPSAPIQPEIQLKEKQGARKSATATAFSKLATETATATTTATTKPTMSAISKYNYTVAKPTAGISAAAAKANAAAAVLAAITLPEATRKSSRTATAIVTAATTSSRLLRAAVEAAKYNCRQMAAANDELGNLRKKCTNANEVATTTTTTKSTIAAAATVTTSTTKSSHKRVPVVKMEDRMGDLKNEKKKNKELKRNLTYSEDDDDEEEEPRAYTSKTIKVEKGNTDTNKDVANAYRGGVNNYDEDDDDDDDDDDDEDDDEEVDNDDEKDEDYVHCIRSRRKSVAYDNLSALWQSSGNTSAISRKQRAALREEQKYKLALLTAEVEDENLTTRSTGETVRGGKRKKCSDTPTKPAKLKTAGIVSNSNKKSSKIAITDCAPAETTPTTPTTPTPPKTPKINERNKFDLANSTRLNQMRYSFERVPVTDLWYRVFTRQDTNTERFFEYYGSTNYRKLPYELGPIPFARTLNNGVCCKLCEKQRSSSQFVLSNKEGKRERGGFSTTTQKVCKVKKEPMEDSETAAAANKSIESSSGQSNEMANAINTCVMSGNENNVKTIGSTTTTMTTNANTQYTHKHKKLAFLQRYRQEQQELQKRQAEQQMSAQQLTDNSNSNQLLQCDTKSTTTPLQERTPRDRKRAGSTHSTTSSTSCASSTATTKASKNRYLNKHLNKAAAAFLNLELPPRKSPREHASTLALVSCIIKQRQDSQSKPNSETDEPSTTTPTQISTATVDFAEADVVMNAASTTTAASIHVKKPPAVTTDPSGSAKASTPNHESPTVLRSPRHTRSAAATPVEEMRFTTVISENVKRMRRGQNKYDHSPPIALTQSAIARKSGRGRPPRTYCGLQKFLHNTGRAVANNRRSQTPNVLISGATASTGNRRRRVKHGAGWTVTTGLAGSGRRHHSYTGLLAQGTTLPSIRKTGSKKGVLEFEVDAAALKALDAATQHTNVRQLEWQIDKYLQLYGSEYDVNDEDLVLRISENGDTVKAPTPRHSATATTTTTTTKKSSISSAASTATTTASTSKALRRFSIANNADVKRSSCPATATTQAGGAAALPFDSTNTPPPTDYFSSDFDLYDLFTNAMGGGSGASDDEQSTADVSGKRKNKAFSLYSSLAMQNYFRKRKSLKSNRTGWPKVQKKKTSARQQHILARKIRFLQDIGELPSNSSNGIKEEPNCEASKVDEEEEDDEEEEGEGVENDAVAAAAASCREVQRRRGNGVITPPESEAEVKQNNVNDDDEEEDGGDEDTELDVAESIPEEEECEEVEEEDEIEDDGETMADTIDEEEDDEEEEEITQTARDADADAALEADEEDVDDAELDVADAAIGEAEYNDYDDTLMDDDSLHVPAVRKRNRRQRRRRTNTAVSLLEEEKHITTNSLKTAHTSSSNNNNAINNNGVTSTPTKQLLRGGGSSALRRTPQLLLNGSLGSCISPSEKAGDNSDIFTVSSDGLDTDLDMSNSQHKCDDEQLHHNEHHHQHHHHHHLHQDQCANHQTPKRKFDITKYAPNNATSSSCAAEAATAAVKSLAISQFLKKEVRVTCRRLRAPFRRYRYRR